MKQQTATGYQLPAATCVCRAACRQREAGSGQLSRHDRKVVA